MRKKVQEITESKQYDFFQSYRGLTNLHRSTTFPILLNKRNELDFFVLDDKGELVEERRIVTELDYPREYLVAKDGQITVWHGAVRCIESRKSLGVQILFKHYF